VLLERVGSVDGEASALLERLHAAATRLAGDLSTLDTNMGELYDAASGRAPAASDVQSAAEPRAIARQESGAGSRAGAKAAATAPASAGAETAGASSAARAPAPPSSAPAEARDAVSEPDTQPSGPGVSATGEGEPAEPAPRESAPVGSDLDGARLVALNMALNGESRAATERYLAEHFQLRERDKLIDEVYAAIEA